MTDLNYANHQRARDELIDLIARLIAREHYRSSSHTTPNQDPMPDTDSRACASTNTKGTTCPDR